MEPLLPIRHSQTDIFICDVFDTWKDDTASMEHPVFSLSTKPDLRIRKYEHNGNKIEVFPASQGLATIHDKDILLYLGSQLMTAINRGETPPQTLRFIAYDLLVATNRTTNNLGYHRLKAALDRITGTRIKTNIETNGERQIKNFGILDSYGIVEKSPINERMVAIEVKLSDWFYNALLGREVLKISEDYFRLRRPIERRLYELGRKHCGKKQEGWPIGLDKLKKKMGSSSSNKEFKRLIKKVSESNHLPDYTISIEGENVIFKQRHTPKPFYANTNLPEKLDGQTFKGQLIIDRVRAMGRGCPYSLYYEFKTWNEVNETILENWQAAFLGFCRKKLTD